MGAVVGLVGDVMGAEVGAETGAVVAAGTVAAPGNESKTLERVRTEKTERETQVTAKIAATHRVIFCAKVVAPVAPSTEFDPPPPPKTPTDPDFES